MASGSQQGGGTVLTNGNGHSTETDGAALDRDSLRLSLPNRESSSPKMIHMNGSLDETDHHVLSGSSSPHHVTPFSPSRTPRFPKHKPSPMDSTYADLAQQVLKDSRTDESRCANYEFPEEIPIESIEEKNTRVQKVVSYASALKQRSAHTSPERATGATTPSKTILP